MDLAVGHDPPDTGDAGLFVHIQPGATGRKDLASEALRNQGAGPWDDLGALEQFTRRAPQVMRVGATGWGSTEVESRSDPIRARVRPTKEETASVPWPGPDQAKIDRSHFHGVGCHKVA
jgi:hypothetical protein